MDFAQAKNSYRENAVVQKQMAENLISFLVKTSGNAFDTVFEIGSGTGFLTDEIRGKIKFQKIILNDLTDNFTNFNPDLYIKGDINKIIMPEDIDLIISNAVFQWIEDFNLLFERLYKSLKNNGIVCFSYFGEKNFSQIKNITGIGLLYPVLDEIIKNKGFKILYFEQELKTLYFKNMKDLLKHIKYTGVRTENKSWTRKDFNFFEEMYSKNYKDELGFELTYHPVYYIIQAI